jgi:hypothetical protein
MIRAQLDAESRRYNAPFVALNEMRPPTREELAVHPKPHRGRPRSKPGLRSVRVLVTMPPSLLARTDARAKRRGTTRAGLIQAALESLLGRGKSA